MHIVVAIPLPCIFLKLFNLCTARKRCKAVLQSKFSSCGIKLTPNNIAASQKYNYLSPVDVFLFVNFLLTNSAAAIPIANAKTGHTYWSALLQCPIDKLTPNKSMLPVCAFAKSFTSAKITVCVHKSAGQCEQYHNRK